MIDIQALQAKIDSGELQEEYAEFRSADGTTPYQIAVVLNEVLEALQIQKDGKAYRVTPQMMYNYAKNGRINGTKGTKRYTEDEVEKFIEKFVAKLV